MPIEGRTRITELASWAPDTIPLDEGALAIAALYRPDVDETSSRATLDELAERVRQRTEGAKDHDRLAALIQVLARDAGYAGNTANYYDPRNSFLNEVLLRRVGIPITLGVVYMEVARRAGIRLVGVSFPGHFLVRYPGPERPVILDCFAGASEVGEAELRARLRTPKRTAPNDAAAGRFLHQLLDGATSRDILVRMLGNLKAVYLDAHDLSRALAAVDAIVALAPDATTELRDRGALYHRLECFGAALKDYRRYTTLAPSARDVPAIRRAIIDLERRVARLH